MFARSALPRFGVTDMAGPAGDPAALGTAPFVSSLGDYYQTNPISRASPTMAECSARVRPSGSPCVPMQAAE